MGPSLVRCHIAAMAAAGTICALLRKRHHAQLCVPVALHEMLARTARRAAERPDPKFPANAPDPCAGDSDCEGSGEVLAAHDSAGDVSYSVQQDGVAEDPPSPAHPLAIAEEDAYVMLHDDELIITSADVAPEDALCDAMTCAFLGTVHPDGLRCSVASLDARAAREHLDNVGRTAPSRVCGHVFAAGDVCWNCRECQPFALFCMEWHGAEVTPWPFSEFHANFEVATVLNFALNTMAVHEQVKTPGDARLD